MKRTETTTYVTDQGRELLKLLGTTAVVIVCNVNADELDELASACHAAAEELRATQGAEETVTA